MDKDSFETLLDNLQCPLCCLAMLPPLRAPMIIPGCGHTICETCISKLHECPFCHHEISNPVRNIIVLQILDTLDHQKLIPTILNPPPPQPNKLIPKVDHICTYNASGNRYIKQKFYHCKTCSIIGNSGICEVCVQKCHKGHDVSRFVESTSSFCDCPDICPCKSILRDTSSLRCSFETSFGNQIEQPMYQCDDCDITGDSYICQGCAIMCHHGHNLRYFDRVKGKHCRCLDMSDCQISTRKPICTFLFSGEKFIRQPWYHCRTCGLVGDLGCCSACAHYCHKGHDVVYDGVHESCYCDCGGNDNGKCKIIGDQNSSYLVRCTKLKVGQIDKPLVQRMYNCETCGLSGICEACAINCHVNHSIVFNGMKEFCCTCQNSSKCIMMLSPLLHNYRTNCDRLDLEPDDVSACYTCYKCDKSGNKKLCETCAIKNHLNHDIHFVGYMKFACSEKDL